MKQMEKVVKIAEAKYPKEQGYRLYWIFDVNRMNAKEGRCQPLMHDTIFEGKQIAMTKLARIRTGYYVRIPRGMIVVTTSK